MFANEQQRQAAIQNARNWLGTRQPHEAAHLNELITSESSWRHDVDSGTGATGLGQFIRGTWKDTLSFARNNINPSELPPGVTFDSLADYDTQAKRPLASVFMSWANAKRIESTALKNANAKRLRAGLPNVTSLMEAMDGDPRKWSTILAVGHKDGASRTNWFLGEQGQFDPTDAIGNYQERYGKFQRKADDLRAEALTAEAAGQKAKATSLFKQSQRARNNDSVGHVFGYADRIATAVGSAQGLEPLEYSAEQLQDFLALSRPADTDDNPARRGFLNRIETGVGLQPAPATAPATANTPETEQSLGSALLGLIVPPAASGQAQTAALQAGQEVIVPGEAQPEPSSSTAQGIGAGLREFGGNVLQTLDPRDELAFIGSEIVGGLQGLNPVNQVQSIVDNLTAAQSGGDVGTGAQVVSDFLEGLTGGAISEAAQNQQAAELQDLGITGLPPSQTALNLAGDIPGLAPTVPNSQLAQLASVSGLENARAGALFTQRAEEIQQLAAQRADQLQAQDAALLGLALTPSPEITGTNASIQAIGGGDNPYSSLGVQGPNFQELSSPLGVQSPATKSLGALASFVDRANNGGFLEAARGDVLSNIAAADPLEAARIESASRAGLNPLYSLELAEQLFELNRGSEVQDQLNLPAFDQLNQLMQLPSFQRSMQGESGFIKEARKLLDANIGLRASDYVNANRY